MMNNYCLLISVYQFPGQYIGYKHEKNIFWIIQILQEGNGIELKCISR